MTYRFIARIEEKLGAVRPIWVVIAAVVAMCLILFISIVMTAIASRESSVKSNARRNWVFFIAALYCCAATILIFFLEESPRTAVSFMTVPAFVLLWAFLCEAIFEHIECHYRRKDADLCAPEPKVITKLMTQAEQRERGREEMEKWRSEIGEIKAVTDAEGDEIRQWKSEQERKQLASLTQPAPATKTASKFDSLQAKLDLLKKGNSSRATPKPEPRGKYDEREVKSALDSLIRSMNANRRGE